MNSCGQKTFFTLIIFIISVQSFSQTKSWEYFGEKPPQTEAKIFAPEFIGSGLPTRDMAITPDGKEIYFTVHGPAYNFSTILFCKFVDEKWTKPEVATFAINSKYAFTEPCISPDGKKFFFVSNQPNISADVEKGSYDIRLMNRINDKWSEPENLSDQINTDSDEYFPSVTNDGTIYFTRESEDGTNAIYRSRFVNGKYSQSEKLPDIVNFGADRFNAFISPDEDYLIVSVFRAKDGFGATDYFILFRNSDDTWQDPINMGEKVNSRFNEYSPYVSRDGKYFFFMSMKPDENLFNGSTQLNFSLLKKIHNSPGNGNNSIYWISADIISQLREKAFNKNQ